jgi:hypothetical protein
MGLVERKQLIDNIVPPFDSLLATHLVDEFISIERRFIQRDWEPANLDGGQFAEAAGKILYQLDSGENPFTKEFGHCAKYIENNDVKHQLKSHTEFRNIKHLFKVLGVIWQFRSERGAVHISATYSPNHMDSKFLVESVRWSMNELLRIFWTGDKEAVAKVIRELLRFDVPSIGAFGDSILVQRTDLKPEEELLLLLHFAGEIGYSRYELGRYSMLSPPLVTKYLQHLSSSKARQIILINTIHGDRYVLTDLGHRRIRNDLSDKLLLH